MESFVAQYAGVIVAILGFLIAALSWFVRQDRAQLLTGLRDLSEHLSDVAQALDNLRDELHRAILGHERRLAMLEGKLGLIRRGDSDV